MPTDRPFPQIDTCVALYLDAWDLFGDRSFAPDDLARRLVQHERSVDAIADPDEPQRHLDLLIAYGLLEPEGDENYRVRCRPDEDVEQWERVQRFQLEAVHRRVQQRKQRLKNDPSEGTVDAGRLQRRGETFASLRVDEDSTVQDVAALVVNRFDRETDAGVALRAPAVLTGHVQQLADDVCGPRSEADGGIPCFEKVTSDVVGEHKDDLEYRLYLRQIE